jgi:hypothetical protein
MALILRHEKKLQHAKMNRLFILANDVYEKMASKSFLKEATVNIIQDALIKYHNEQRQLSEIHQIADEFKDNYKRSLFNVFWAKYDKKVGKSPTLQKWMRLKKSEIEMILQTVDDFVSTHSDAQFRPNPLTYLRQRRWEDELSINKKMELDFTVNKNTWQY